MKNDEKYLRFHSTIAEVKTRKGESVLRYRGNDKRNHYIASSLEPDGGKSELITRDGFSGALAAAQVIKTTWSELKALRDGGELIPGSLYRITDYQCTTTQENTRSAGHQFDIVLLALSENKLAEEGWAMEHPTDVYDVTFDDGVTKKCYLNFDIPLANGQVVNIVDVETLQGIRNVNIENLNIDREAKTAITEDFDSTELTTEDFDSTELTTEGLQYNYFQNSNLSAWKVWYCLDNDTSRFPWAQRHQEGSPACITRKKQTNIDVNEFVRNSEIDFIGIKRNYYGWTYNNTNIFTESETPSNGDSVYDAGESNHEGWEVATFNEGSPQIDEGKGVIYRLIDEWNNDVAYDYKNIQFLKNFDSDALHIAEEGDEAWFYTFSNLDSYPDDIVDGSVTGESFYNRIESTFYPFIGTPIPINIFIGSASFCKISDSYNTLVYFGANVTIGSCCENITIDSPNNGIYQITIPPNCNDLEIIDGAAAGNNPFEVTLLNAAGDVSITESGIYYMSGSTLTKLGASGGGIGFERP